MFLALLINSWAEGLFTLFSKINMEGPYGSQWPTEEKVKHREMVSTQARYIFVHEASHANANGKPSKSDGEKTSTTLNKKDPMVAFVHFRFIIEEMIPVLYVYELQIEPRFQGRGLGTFLMELIELIACKVPVSAFSLPPCVHKHRYIEKKYGFELILKLQ